MCNLLIAHIRLVSKVSMSLRFLITRSLCTLALAATAIFAAVSANPAMADAIAERATDEQIRLTMAEIASSGRVSDDARRILMTRPAIASQVIDPGSAVLVDKAGEDFLEDQGRFGQRTADRYIKYLSLTGGRGLEYHFSVTWNYNGKTVTSTPGRTHYITTGTVGIYDRGFTSNTATARPGSYAYTVVMQAEWEQCILKVGCVAQDNPFTQMGVYFDGTYNIVQRP
jgi:hypothetical protein